MDVTRWLHEIGLPQYADLFRANNIDASLLSSLTNEDLKELGVGSLGHRKRLIAAIGTLPDLSTENGEPLIPGGQTTASVAGPAAAERRQLTIMFCDLVGSTTLAASLDPEELRDIVRAYHACCADVVRRFDGSIAQYLGDGVLVRFGYPNAHEDDAERAVHCGLDLITAVGALNTPAGTALKIRIGIATGLVVVGDQLGAEPTQERAAVGETPNLAARIQAAAAPCSARPVRRAADQGPRSTGGSQRGDCPPAAALGLRQRW